MPQWLRRLCRSACVRRSHRQSLRRQKHSDAERTCRAVTAVGPTQFTPPRQTTRRSCLCLVWCAGVNWTIRPTVNVFRFQFFVGHAKADATLAGYLQDGRSGTPSRPRGPADISPETDPSSLPVHVPVWS